MSTSEARQVESKSMTTSIVKRLIKSNSDKIMSDARTALPYDTVFYLTELIEGVYLSVIDSPFAGDYRVIKNRAPRWLGDNGYTFARKLNAIDTLVLNERYSVEDYAQATEDHDVRETHFARLENLTRLNRSNT